MPELQNKERLKMDSLYPLLFKSNLYAKVWGGNRLKPLKGLPADDEPVGESWEISAVRGKESVVANGSLQGRTLTALVDEYREQLLGHAVYDMYGTEFPLLIKFIDAAKDLSIQVHPDDEMAMRRHKSFGKTEMWYLMDARPGAKLYSGFKSPISRYEYAKRIEDGSICDVLAVHPVEEGDVFYIPAGRVHALCSGTMVAEVQQSSDLTYRIFDYNRPGLDGRPRELHTELAAEAIDYTVESDYRTHYTRQINKPVCLSESPFFTVKLLEADRAFHRKLYKYDSFVVYMCLEGDCLVRLRSWRGGEPEIKCVELRKGFSCLIPAAVADFDVVPQPENPTTKLLEVYIDNKHY